MSGDELELAIMQILDRSDHVADWPRDERELHRSDGWQSFAERHAAVTRLRARKIIRLVKP